MRFRYLFRRGRTAGDLGAGAGADALQQPQTLPRNDGFFRAGYAVARSFGPQAPGFVQIGQQFVSVDLLGNGSNIGGQLSLQALAKLQGKS